MKNLSFKAKLLALCGFLTTIIIVLGVTAYRGLHEVESTYGKIPEQVMPKLEEANEMFVEYRRIRITLRTLGLPGITKEQEEEAVKGALEAISAYEESNEKYVSYGFINGQKELYEELNSSWKIFKAVGERVLTLHKIGRPEDKEAIIGIFFKDCPDAANHYTAAINKLLSFHKDIAKLRKEEAEKTANATNSLILIVAIVGTLLGLSIGFIFATKVSNSINNVAKSLASNAEQVTAASGQIASSSQELSQAATEQASSLEETAASLEEITAMISKASDSAESTATSSAESHKKAEEGRSAVDQMLTSMDEISQSNEAILTQINDSNRQMTEIVKVIQEIGTKTKVINEIVFQTKLLSFNASVEAARAGEHGKGFAVVAEEVGNLAQMSGNAAKEITEMLDGSISKVEKIVEETKSKVETLVQRGKEKVDSGVTVAKQCSDVLNEIVQNVSRVSGLSQEISQANKEQAQGVAEINKAMSQLDTVTQQNAATSEEAASAAEELSAQAESLKASVGDLVRVINGSDSSGVMSTPPPVVQSRKSSSSAQSKKTNIVHLKSPKKSPRFDSANSNLKMASGDDSSIPNREDDGFKDV